MREYLTALAQRVHAEVARCQGPQGRSVVGSSPGGDAQFGIDAVAEQAVENFLRERGGQMAVYSEDRGLRAFGRDPRYLLVVDPVDGTRSAAAGLESACVSVAAARMSAAPVLDDVEHAVLREIHGGATLYAGRAADGLVATGYPTAVPALSRTADLDRMFWSIEFNGHPARLMVAAYGHLIDRSANTGGVFVFNSASFSLSRIVTGQLDAYVDIGNRLLRDRPELRPEFLAAGNGRILHLFPYDIAAAVLIAEKAGVVVTDAYGKPLGPTRLLDIDERNQQSCVAASTPELHQRLLDAIHW